LKKQPLTDHAERLFFFFILLTFQKYLCQPSLFTTSNSSLNYAVYPDKPMSASYPVA